MYKVLISIKKNILENGAISCSKHMKVKNSGTVINIT